MKTTNKTITIYLVLLFVVLFLGFISLNSPSDVVKSTGTLILFILFLFILIFSNEAYADRDGISIKMRKQLSKEALDEVIIGSMVLVFIGAILFAFYAIFRWIL